MRYDMRENYAKTRIIVSAAILGAMLPFLVLATMPIIAQAQQTSNNNTNTTANSTQQTGGSNGAANATSSGAATSTTVTIVKGAENPSSQQFYDPTEVKVSRGRTVTWENEDTAIHTATSGKGVTPDGKFDTGLIAPGQPSQPIIMPTQSGEYPYFCTLHPWMNGKVEVG